MITVTYKKANRLVLGIKTEEGILDVEAAASAFPEVRDVPDTVTDLITQGAAGKNALLSLAEKANGERTFYLNEDGLEYGPCVPNPQKILCIGLNIESTPTKRKWHILLYRFCSANSRTRWQRMEKKL